MAAVSILDLVNLYFLVIYRNIVKLMESDSIKTCCKSINCVNTVLELEIWLKEFLVKRLLFLLETL